jgi:organic radical activating enzyme
MGKIIFKRISFDVTFRCTLKCKLCCSYTPYFAAPVPHYSYEELTRGISRFFELADYVNVFTIGGGEPLLHEKLSDIFKYLCQFRNRIGRLEVITNGTIVPNKRLIESLKESNARVLIDDYGPNLSKKVSEIVSALEIENVSNERRYNSNTDKGAYCNGWVDLSEFSNIASSYENAKKLFDNCVQANELRCHPVIGGKIYVCPAYEYCLRLGKYSSSPDFFIDLYDEVTPVLEQKEKVRKFLKTNFLPSCGYCKGWLKDSKRYIPAEQLE